MASTLFRILGLSATILLALFAQRAAGQHLSVQGAIIDEESNPVCYASVIVKDDSTQLLLGTMSDPDGKFSLNLLSHFNNDTLKISSVGFETLRVPVRQVKGNIKPFRLHQSTTTLPTIVFRGLSASELIRECVKEIPLNYRNVSFINKAYYWKTTKDNSCYRSLDEGFMTVREDHGTDGSKRIFSYDSTSRVGVQQSDFISFDKVENLFYFDFIRTRSGITNPDNLDEWTFEYIHAPAAYDANLTVVRATRDDKLGHFMIYINTMDYSFERVEFSYRWPPNFHTIDNSMLYKLSHIEGIVQYAKTGRKYSINYLYASLAYSTYKRFTFEKLFSRSTDFEFTLLSSVELKLGKASRESSSSIRYGKVIVNTARYLDAITALGGKNDFCD